jgi:hypothetical protein
VPLTAPGGKPVIAEPGDTPRSPLIVVKPVFVTVEPANTEYGSSAPSEGDMANAGLAKTVEENTPITMTERIEKIEMTPTFIFRIFLAFYKLLSEH